MSNELNLFLGETKETSTPKVSSEVKTEKTGNSMFDKMLLNIKDANQPSTHPSSVQSNQKAQTSSNQVEVKIQHTNEVNATDNKTTATAEIKNDETSAEDKKTSKPGNNSLPKELKESKESKEKSGSSTLSLLDRMMLEANTKISAESVKDTHSNNAQSTQNKTSPFEVSKNDNTIDGINKNPENILNNNNNNKKIENEKATNAKSVDSSVSIPKEVNPLISTAEGLSQIEIEKPVKEDSPNIENATKKEATKKIEDISSKVIVLKEQITNSDESLPLNASEDIPKNTVTEETDVRQNNEVKKENSKSVHNLSLDEIKPDTDTEKMTHKDVNPVVNKEQENVSYVHQDKNENSVINNEEKNNVKNTETEKNVNTEAQKAVVKNEIEVKTVITDAIKTSRMIETNVVKSENVASELSKIINSDIETVVNITKEEIGKLPDVEKIVKTQIADNKEPEKMSLLDKLIEESKQLSKNQNNKLINKEEINIEVPKTAELTEKQSAEKNVNSFFTNMYLSSQKNNLNEASIVKVATGKKMATDATSIKDVQKSAEFLDLGFEDSEVTVKMQEFEKHSKLNILDKLAFIKTVMKDDLINDNALISKYTTAATSTAHITNASANAGNETVVQLNVSPANVINIESKIIGARQQMGTMMSEVARNMYLNYKPPVTAFRINLTPGNLGSIAILMKNDKEKGLSISLNMSNTATLDSFVDNQASLRAALSKNFSTDANFTLDFSMQEQNSGNDDSQNKQNNQMNQNTNSGNQDVTEVQDVITSENQESRITDYM